ncbi:MAG TPA: NmrA family NAD(P)-binding protein [Actinophytocola sp.]|uniref:NmrA family NAD(P)-binding protein n=1 Tax=Actinophytocola sp. TaxID=1872138 RepID=UPI002DFF426F|nr:NmrA family NAD(P)-binding protein [Actinophytocola sp.]
MRSTVLVTGPTGKVGRRLIPLLTRRDVTVRAANRSPGAPRPGVEPVPFDWTDSGTYEAARKGVAAIYVVTGGIPQAEHAGWVHALLDGAAGAGVRRVVLMSTYGVDQAPADDPLRGIELAVESSGVPYTILRPGAFMQNFSEFHYIGAAESIRERDEIAMPGGDGLVSFVSTEDIGAVAAVALTEDGHGGRAYAPMGPEALTLTQVAEHISAATGRSIGYVETDHTRLRDELIAAGAPPGTAEHNSRLFAYAMSSGALGVHNDDVLEVTGRPPVTFAEYAVGAVAAWRR